MATAFKAVFWSALSRRCTQRLPWLKAVAVGVLTAAAALLVAFLFNAAQLFLAAGGGRVEFLQRVASLNAAGLTALALSMAVRVALLHLLVGAFTAVVLAALNLVWWRLGARQVRRLALFDGVCLAWLYVAGQLQLLAVFPYARSGWLWDGVEPWLRSFWTPAIATITAVAGFGVVAVWAQGKLLAALLPPRKFWRVALRTVGLALLMWTLFLPLLGPRRWGLESAAPARVERPRVVPSKREPPAIVVIGLDSLRPDHIAALGGPRGLTPNIDAFFKEAFVFKRAYTPIAQTFPSWISLLSARTPNQHGVRYNRPDAYFSARLPELLPQKLRREGWRTHFMIDDDLFAAPVFDHGFDTIDQPPSVVRTYMAKHLMDFWLLTLLPARWTSLLLPDLRANRSIYHNYEARDFTRLIAARVQGLEQRGGPFFLAAHLCALHYPGTQPGPLYRALQPAGRPELGFFKVSLPGLGRYEPSVPKAQHARVLGLYRAGVANVDEQVGRLMRTFRESGLLERAWVVLWSDHGESFSDPRGQPIKPNHGAYITNSDQDLRVVLAIRAPGGARLRGASEQLVRTVDVMPTLLDFLGKAPLTGPREGVSLRPLMEGASMAELPYYAESGLKWGSPQQSDERGYNFHIVQTFRGTQAGDLVLRRQFHKEVVLGKHRLWRRGPWQVEFHPTMSGGVWSLTDLTGRRPGDLQAAEPEVFAALKGELEAQMIDLEPAALDKASGGKGVLPPPWWPWPAPPERRVPGRVPERAAPPRGAASP